MANEDIIDRLSEIFTRHGARSYQGGGVSITEHMLQTAAAAEGASCAPGVVAAALLHDVGHFITDFARLEDDPKHASMLEAKVDRHHENAGARMLQPYFPAEVVEPIRLHVQAKRYLSAVEKDYSATLAPQALHTLGLQRHRPKLVAIVQGEHEGERIRGRAWQPAYKAFERDGLVFAYMGPPEEEPPFPEWDGDWGLGPGDEMVPYSNFYPCNWLQVQDNAADQYHHIPLHSTAVVPGHEQGTTFGEAGAAPYEVRPDLQFFRVHEGKAMAWTSSRRVDDEKIFIRVNYQFLPNGSFHSYLFEDGSKRNHFSRTHMFRWVVPVDDENCIMFGWRMFGSHCDPRDVGKKHLVGFEKMDFLEGQCGMRRPERFQYGQGELPPIPRHHRERTAYRDAQHAPGDYEAVSSSRKVAVHALEHLLPFDGGVTMFRQLLRLVIDGKSPGATPEAWRDWLANGPPNSYCSGNVLVVPRAPTMAEEVERRREVAKRVMEATTESDTLQGEARKRFMQDRLAAIEATYAPEPTEA